MKVRVGYTTQLKAALGRGGEEIHLEPPATLPRLLERLVACHGSAFRDLVLDENGRPLPSIVVCVGDQQVDVDTAADLQDGDEVTILSAISGG